MKKINFIEHPAICALPWTGIYVNPDGKVQNCAIISESLGNLHQSSMDQLVNNDRAQQIRQDMLDQTRHSRCNACYSVEDNSDDIRTSESNRNWYKKIAIKHVDTEIFDSTTQFRPTVLDLRWRNTCNRACIYCGPDLSSLWQDLLGTNYGIDENVLERSKQYIQDNLQHVRHVYLAGGEPLLIKENQYLLEKLLDVNPDVEIRVNSNIGNLQTPVFRLLTKFKDVKWTVSVDSHGESFEYMRWPGKWDSFLENLDSIRSIAEDKINFNMVWCILNDIDILDTIDLLLSRGYHENMFVVQCLGFPGPLSVLHLPLQSRMDLKERIWNYRQKTNPDWWLYKSLSSMYNFLDKTRDDRPAMFFQKISMQPGLAGTFQFLHDIDALRGTDSSKIFPRLYQYR